MLYVERKKTIDTINTMAIPKSMLADAAGVSNPARVSDFIKGRSLPVAVEQRIIEAVEGIAFVWSAFRRGAPGVVIVIDSPRILKKLVAACKETEVASELTEATAEASQAFKAAVAQ